MSSHTSLFQVYLRLRPPIRAQPPTHHVEPWLLVEPASLPTSQNEDSAASFPTHITLQPPNDSRKRAIERFGFTKIFQENATQLDVFLETGTADSIRNVLQSGRDGLVATLGVTGSGKVGFKPGRMTQQLIQTESYHPRVQVSTRADADDPRRAVQINRSKHPPNKSPRSTQRP